jgi:YkoY family integral membrane protein
MDSFIQTISDYFAHIPQDWQWLLDNPEKGGSVIFSLIILESLLSVDNAAVLATMVMDLPKEQRGRALKYGIFGAYFFRGLALIFAAVLVQFWQLKILGGLYLLYLTYDYFKSKATASEGDDTINKEEKWYYKMTIGLFGQFWATVAAVEVMDMAFSIDNVFAAAALSKNIILIWIGVFIGILAMRFVAQAFVSLMEKFPFLEKIAFYVIALLGLKLCSSALPHLEMSKDWAFSHWLEGEHADMIFSIITASMFFIPVLTSHFFNFPKKETAE